MVSEALCRERGRALAERTRGSGGEDVLACGAMGEGDGISCVCHCKTRTLVVESVVVASLELQVLVKSIGCLVHGGFSRRRSSGSGLIVSSWHQPAVAIGQICHAYTVGVAARPVPQSSRQSTEKPCLR